MGDGLAVPDVRAAFAECHRIVIVFVVGVDNQGEVHDAVAALNCFHSVGELMFTHSGLCTEGLVAPGVRQFALANGEGQVLGDRMVDREVDGHRAVAGGWQGVGV